MKYIIYDSTGEIQTFWLCLCKICTCRTAQYTTPFGKTSIKVICRDLLSAERKRQTEFWNTSKITLMSKKKSLSSSKLMKQVISYGSNSHFYNQNLS